MKDHISKTSFPMTDPIDQWFKDNRETLFENGTDQIRFVECIYCPDNIAVCWVSPKLLSRIREREKSDAGSKD